MAFQQDVGDVVTKERGITQIGSNIQLNLGDSGGEREAIQRWFAPWLFRDWVEGRSQARILSSSVGRPGCGLWLLNNVLPGWYNSSQDGLWLTGEVGCGKSFLCSSVIQHLTEALRFEDSQNMVVPLIFSFNDKYTHNMEFLTNTILAYFCSAEPIPEPIVQARKLRVSPSTIPEIEDFILHVVTTLRSNKPAKAKASIVLVIDALDEVPCESQTADTRLLNRLMTLNKLSCDFRIRIVLFTRPDNGIQSHCRSELGWRKMPIPPLEVDRDISTAVGTRLEEGTRLGKEDRDRLTAQVVKKAAGMFRLASLYIDELVKSTRRRSIRLTDFERRLEELPATLYVFYDRILGKVEKELIWKTLKALQWIMFSARSFLVEDLMEACAIKPPSREPFDSEQQKILECLDLIDCLSGLVRIQPPLSEAEEMSIELRTHFVTMAHFSVNEYLQQLDTTCFGINPSWFDKTFASSYLSQACFIYLLEATSEAHSTTSKTMLEYANQSWPLHLATYIQATGRTQYAGEATNAALASKIRNLIEFPDLDMYDDCSSLRQHVRDTVQSYLDIGRCNQLFNEILHSTAYCRNAGPRAIIPEPSPVDRRPGDSLYSPLGPGYLRLLIIHPAEKRQDSVQCSLVVDHLRNRANYAYLSYVWGASAQERLIHVNGVPLSIMFNLFEALRGLRDNSKPVIFWVDAICIDQANTMERNHQVAQIAEFVRYASSTQAWLPDECTGDALRPRFLRDLYSQTYWHRRWIQQELILARDIRIQWARVKMSWADLMHLVREQTLKVDKQQPELETLSAINYFSSLQELRESLRLKGPLLKAEAVLYMLRSTVCTCLSDMVPSILPLLSIDEACGLEVDYFSSFRQVMTNLAKVLLERSQGYDVLSMIDSTRGVYDDFGPPSWVPTWTNIEDQPLAPGNAIAKQPKLYEASAEIPAFMVNGETLCVKGWLIGNIAYVAKISEIIRNGKMVKFERRILIRVTLEDRCRENPLWAFQRMTTQSQDWFTELPEASRLLSELESRGSRAGRCIAQTDSELSANVPAHTAVGDVIAIFYGGEVPYVLRPEANAAYILIGECYVDGYMDGQATRKRTNDNPDVTFKLH